MVVIFENRAYSKGISQTKTLHDKERRHQQQSCQLFGPSHLPVSAVCLHASSRQLKLQASKQLLKSAVCLQLLKSAVCLQLLKLAVCLQLALHKILTRMPVIVIYVTFFEGIMTPKAPEGS